MKKLMCMCFVLVMILGMTACGEKEKPEARPLDENTAVETEMKHETENVYGVEDEDVDETVSEASEETLPAAEDVQEAIEEIQETAEEAVTTEEMVDGMRVSFKEAMDSYEEFFDEYAAFMKKYKESDNAATMLTDYLKFMEQYTETMTKLEEWDSSDMNDAELKYYIEVTARINQKLLEAAS